MLQLRYTTDSGWMAAVNADLDQFLQDHAANERKVSQAAMTLVAQHPKHQLLVESLTEVSLEELEHFRAVVQLLRARGQDLGYDMPDPYMGSLQKLLRRSDVKGYLLDRLLVFGIVEARGCERFAMVAAGADDAAIRAFYLDLARSEARHHALYHRLAKEYFPSDVVQARLDELLDAEAAIVRQLPHRAALH